MKVKADSKTGVLVLTFLTVLLGVSGHAIADPHGWKILQLAGEGGSDRPQISGSNVVWSAWGEIYFWDGTTTTHVTNNGYTGEFPQISGSNVMWYGFDGNDYEIYFWSADEPNTITQITDNSYHDGSYDWWEDVNLRISGSNVVWCGYPISNDLPEIFFWNGSTITQLTNNSLWNEFPRISGSNVVWAGWSGGSEDYGILFWNGTTTIKIPDSNNGWIPQISGSNVVWAGGNSGEDNEIFFWDGATTTQITNNSYDDLSPQISGSNVAWYGSDGNDYEIFFWDGATITQVTDNNNSDSVPQISGTNVVWRGRDGDDDAIFFWDASNPGTITQISDNGFSGGYPQISGSSVVWWGNLAVKCTSPPSTDYSGDCKVLFDDFALLSDGWQNTYFIEDLNDMASQWLDCGYDIQGVCWE
ncbi:MAG: hypothetical protein ACYTA5_25305 [Planctomycetota bacterium]|jgi:hypothetical protein